MDKEIRDMEQSPLTDDAALGLIRKIQEGDSSALTELYDKTNPLLFGLISRIVGDSTSAEEVLLDVYTNVWKHAGSFDKDVTVLEWLTGKARRSAVAKLDWNRQGRRKQQPGPAGSPMTVARERQESARASLETMGDIQREVLQSAYFGGMSCDEIAAGIGKPLGAVKSNLRRGLSSIGDSLQTASRQGEKQ